MSNTEKATRLSIFKYDPTDPELVIIGLDTKDGPEHELYDERINLPLDDSMLANISALGVKEPIIVRKTPGKGAKTYEVVDGRRRLMHARQAHKTLLKQGEPGLRIPVMVEAGSDEHVATVAISMNEIRLDDDVLTKAAKAERLMSRLGGDKKAVANAFGVTTVTIDNWAKLMELAAPVKKAVASGQLSAHAASKLHGMDAKDQVAELEKIKSAVQASGKRATARQVESGGSKPPRKVSRKQLEAMAKRLKDASDERGVGILAGIQFALGKSTKPFKEYMKEFAELEAAEADAEAAE